jgi:hypothetical protein
MANESRNERKVDPAEPPQHAGDNRRLGDTDGNATGGNSKSRGVTGPADQPPAARKVDEGEADDTDEPA